MFIHCKNKEIAKIMKLAFVVAVPDFFSRDPLNIHLCFLK